MIASVPAVAQHDDATLHDQVDTLEKVIRKLNSRIEELENRLPPTASPITPSTPATPSATPAVVAVPPSTPATSGSSAGDRPQDGKMEPERRELEAKQRWSDIRQGLSAEDVEHLLGAPDRKLQAGNQTIWHYDYKLLGQGTVAIDASGHVSGFVKPYINFWF
ncbi:MAG: hypothetical protein HY270_21190 [Deltaproteobacteria bacterium]|nr:hypothetical protein [Deltaproteobacteria bacterium]